MENNPNSSGPTGTATRLLMGVVAVALLLAAFSGAGPLGAVLLIAAMVVMGFVVKRLGDAAQGRSSAP